MKLWVFEGLNNDRPDIKYFLEKYMEITPDVLFWDKTPTLYCADHWVDEVEDAVAKYGKPDLMLGASMGGFGALLFQPIIQAKKCIIFGPQADARYEILTTLPDDNFYWGERMKAHHGKVIPEYSNGDIDIYFGHGDCDKYHRQLCIDNGYNIIDINTPIHCAFTHLFETDKLVDIIRENLC
jgi:hypothetical protein